MINYRIKQGIFKLLCCIAVFFLALMTQSFSLADHFTVSHVTYDTTYDKILQMYVKVLNGLGTVDYGRHDLFNPAVYSGFDPSMGYEAIIKATKKDCGYAVCDINQDGIDELLIGVDGSFINSVFTMDDGRVRELIRAGGYGTGSSNYTCSMLVDGLFFRWGHGGAGLDYYETWQMNGTGPVSFAEGYHSAYVWDSDSESSNLIWYRSNAQMSKVASPSNARVNETAAKKWIREQEQNIYKIRFVPFAVYEKYPDDPWNIAVLSVNGKTNSSAKVNVRKEPDTKSKLVAAKNAGTYVRVISKEGEYYKIAFDSKEGYIQQEYLTPLTYVIPQEPDVLPDQGDDGVYEAGDSINNLERYPMIGTTNRGDVNIRREAGKKSKLLATIKRKGTTLTITGELTDGDGTAWYKIEYNGKEGFVRCEFVELPKDDDTNNGSSGELYGLVIKRLATRSGPSPRAEDTGTYSVKGQRIRVYSRVYDPIENAWWVKCDVPYHGETRTLWAWYTRFDSKTLPLESIPIDEDY